MALVAGAGYYFRYRTPEEPAPETDGTAPSLPLPVPASTTASLPSGTENGAKDSGFGLLAPQQAIAYFSDGENFRLVQPDGQIVEVGGGKSSVLSGSAVENIISASFSHDGSRVLLAFGNPDSPQTSVFSAATKTWQPLAQAASWPVWSPIDDRIAYLAPGPSRSTLTLLDLANPKAKPQSLLALNAVDIRLAWDSPKEIFILDAPSAWAAGSWKAVDIAKKTVRSVVSDRLGLQEVWGEAAQTGLIFTGNQNFKGGSLSLVDGQGRAIQNIKLGTLPAKCTFYQTPPAAAAGVSSTTATSSISKSYLACALPRDPRSLGINPLPDSYFQKIFFTQDDFYLIDLKSGSLQAISSGEWQMPVWDATDLKTSKGVLFFRNRYDNRIYWLKLPA